MKALTVMQPWASLIAVGAKTIETRSWPAPADAIGQPLVIHAGKSNSAMNYLGWLEEHHGEAEPSLEPFADRIQMVDRTGRGILTAVHDLPLGAVVASCTLTDCVPIVDTEGLDTSGLNGVVLVEPNSLRHWRPTDHYADAPRLDDQRPFGDFSPGNWAWILSNVKPTSERCPACWNRAWTLGSYKSCPVCHANGGCNPVPARGRQGLWNFDMPVLEDMAGGKAQ